MRQSFGLGGSLGTCLAVSQLPSAAAPASLQEVSPSLGDSALVFPDVRCCSKVIRVVSSLSRQ